MADDPDRQMTASERFCAAVGIPHPGRLDADDAEAFERAQDQVDADLANRYGRTQRHAA